jgi:hypothetical protein
VDRRQSAITTRPHQRRQQQPKKQEVDKLLQNRPVKRGSLQTKYARRRRRKKWSVSIVCVTAMNQMKKKSIDCARTLDWLNILLGRGASLLFAVR